MEDLFILHSDLKECGGRVLLLGPTGVLSSQTPGNLVKLVGQSQVDWLI